jgi:hypothetical protein
MTASAATCFAETYASVLCPSFWTFLLRGQLAWTTPCCYFQFSSDRLVYAIGCIDASRCDLNMQQTLERSLCKSATSMANGSQILLHVLFWPPRSIFFLCLCQRKTQGAIHTIGDEFWARLVGCIDYLAHCVRDVLTYAAICTKITLLSNYSTDWPSGETISRI